MKSNLLKAKAMLPYVYEKAKFNSEDLFVILEGITGFFSGAMGKDPFAALGSALGVSRHFAGKCDLGEFRNNNSTQKVQTTQDAASSRTQTPRRITFQ